MSNSSANSSATTVQRSGRSSTKLRFGRDKVFRTTSGPSKLRTALSDSNNSVESASSGGDGEESCGWRIGSYERASQRSAEQHLDIANNAAQQLVVPEPVGTCRSLADLDILATIGTGTFGRVKLAQGRQDGRHYALKILRKEQLLRMKQVQHVLNERRLLAAVDHPLVIKMYGTFQDEARLYMLMEFVPGGELFSHLRAAGRFTTSAARFYTACVVSALHHLHSHDIVYRDLKPENLLIAPTGYVKLCDFGFAKRLGPGPRARTFTLCGTPEYLSPELVSNAGHGKGVDWWAVGVLLFEMLAGYPPWQESNTYQVYRAVMTGQLSYPHHFDPDAKDLIRQLMSKEAMGRLGCGPAGGNELKSHPFLSPIDFAALEAGMLDPPFVPQLSGDGDARHFGKHARSGDGGAEVLLDLPAASTAFREF